MSNAAEATVHNLRASFPDPDFPLNPPGMAKYREYCAMFAETGQLSALVREEVQKLAIATDQIAAAYAAGKAPSKAASEGYSSAIRSLKRLTGEEASSDGAPSGHNPFASFGFADRARKAKHNKGD